MKYPSSKHPQMEPKPHKLGGPSEARFSTQIKNPLDQTERVCEPKSHALFLAHTQFPASLHYQLASSDRDHDRYPGRDSHDPSALHATATLAGSDHSEDDSNMPLHRADGPTAQLPTDNDAHAGPSNRRPRHSPDLAPARAARTGTAVVRLRCTRQSVPQQGR